MHLPSAPSFYCSQPICLALHVPSAYQRLAESTTLPLSPADSQLLWLWRLWASCWPATVAWSALCSISGLALKVWSPCKYMHQTFAPLFSRSATWTALAAQATSASRGIACRQVFWRYSCGSHLGRSSANTQRNSTVLMEPELILSLGALWSHWVWNLRQPVLQHTSRVILIRSTFSQCHCGCCCQWHLSLTLASLLRRGLHHLLASSHALYASLAITNLGFSETQSSLPAKLPSISMQKNNSYLLSIYL